MAASDAVTLLHETGFYPVAYFPPSDVGAGLLRPSGKRTSHPELGQAAWWSVRAGDQTFADVAWSYPSPPEHAAAMRGLVAFAWARMDAFYEEDEPIFGHAADPYHRVDVRASSRHVTVRLGGQVVADTRAPLAVFETGFAVRWYLPRRHIAAGGTSPPPSGARPGAGGMAASRPDRRGGCPANSLTRPTGSRWFRWPSRHRR